MEGGPVYPCGAEWDGHLLLLHDSEEQRRASLSAWVRRGLEEREKVIYAQTEHKSPDRSVLEVLSQHGLDVAAATSEGRLELLHPSDFYATSGQDDVVDRALAEGYAGVRMSADAGTALSVMSAADHHAAELTMNETCRTRPLSALCQYDASTTTGARLTRAATTHATGIRERLLHTRPVPGGIALTGEIDLSNCDLLVTALDAATSAHYGRCTVDLSGVTFLGVAGCRAISLGTEPFRERGGRVTMTGSTPIVARTLRAVGLDREPNLLIGDQDVL